MLEIENIGFSYENQNILQQVSFKLKKGEIASLIGASGSGKTTLFKLMTGMISPSWGTISINNHALPTVNHFVSYMMQEDLLLPWRTVLGNMTLTSELGNYPQTSQDFNNEAMNLLAEMGMAGHEEMFPDQLSGGMRQRVSLARALLQKRPLLLLDEPFGALDVSLREHMYALLRKAQVKYGTTILMITHDFRDALTLSDRVLYLADGKIKQEWAIPGSVKQDAHAMGILHESLRFALLS